MKNIFASLAPLTRKINHQHVQFAFALLALALLALGAGAPMEGGGIVGQ